MRTPIISEPYSSAEVNDYIKKINKESRLNITSRLVFGVLLVAFNFGLLYFNLVLLSDVSLFAQFFTLASIAISFLNCFYIYSSLMVYPPAFVDYSLKHLLEAASECKSPEAAGFILMITEQRRGITLPELTCFAAYLKDKKQRELNEMTEGQ